MAERMTFDDIKMALLECETRMGRVGQWNIAERWKSGTLLCTLRAKDTNYLPKGQLASAAATLKVSPRELSDRMRVAEMFRTQAEFKAAVVRFGNWTGILRSLVPTREARTGSTRPPKQWLRILYEALGHVLAKNLAQGERRVLCQRLYDNLDRDGF